MKKLQIILSSILGALFFFACDDYNEQEFLKPAGTEIEEDIAVTKNQNSQAVLLEEHTGWGCNNCPRAAEKLEDLKTAFGDKLVAVAIHAGTLAQPGKSNNYLDLRTDYGNTLADFFGINARPAGIINRNNTMVQYSDWESVINSELSSNTHSINIGLGVKESGNQIYIGTELSFIRDVNSELLLTLVVVEDDIVGVQRDGTEKIEDYVFKNVLRANPLIEMQINTEKVSANETLKKNYAIKIDSNWNLDNCRVVAIVTDKNTGKVLQTNEIFVRNS